MKDHNWREPTAEELDQAKRVQLAICHELNLMGREGTHPAVLLAGTGSAIAALITSVWGNSHVPSWFHHQGDMTAELLRGGN